ncbi:MAG TPA: universal stress protein, UspA [Halieaceae bacterium]|jgi:universal stress protein E|uniref:universal stress protein n=1 Tax=Haliea TaxID=475794 RepID=UPI000C3572F6|nr:universal stress protein [Haliea sp.]HBQ40639.1 universal stress protein, UspA [Halieaceae bacterium]MAD62871.1 universal stress protein, UspA [Haliea sp.]MAY94413.1 universal stress protein, UspA [Haliea sp.]MBP69754.1 universal stress protein, UspA [Haliea sp.]HCD55440.1 universal stress protein, UspA [Halieaceae bacterium]|tara:strand:+ start:4734 stop:5723 length:990 start_codon:yes stop_codon:yes gene_type:complete
MKRFKHILCVLEADASSELAWERAVALAESNQAALTVATVIPRLPSITGLSHAGRDPVDLQSALRQQHEARLASLTAHHQRGASIPHTVLTGISFLEIIREVLRGSHDLVIKCPESPDWLDRFFAGDDMQLLRQCPCPVWFVKPDVAGPYKRILAAVDVAQFHPPEDLARHRRLNVQVLEMAASLALAESAELHVVHAWEAMTELASNLAVSASIPKDRLASGIEQERLQHRQQLDRLLHDIGALNPAAQEALRYLAPRTHLVKGSPRQEVPLLARQLEVDCLVMGTVARTGIRGFFMGNTAETILEQIDCSVLAIKPEGFATPVTAND